jgi:hypothetical protein
MNLLSFAERISSAALKRQCWRIRFTEGFDTPDLHEAKRLLTELR